MSLETRIHRLEARAAVMDGSDIRAYIVPGDETHLPCMMYDTPTGPRLLFVLPCSYRGEWDMGPFQCTEWDSSHPLTPERERLRPRFEPS